MTASPLAIQTLESTAWWLDANEEDRAQRVIQATTAIWRDQSVPRQEMVSNARLYGNLPLLGLSPSLYRRRSVTSHRGKLGWNVTKRVCDMYVALLTDEQVKCTFQTIDGDWGLQQRASQLEAFVSGTFYDCDLYNLAARCALDSAVFGIGCCKIIEDNSQGKPRIAIERVQPWTLLVDDQEAFDGNPQTVYQIIYADRLSLMAQYPAQADEIAAASCGEFEDWGSNAISLNLDSKVIVIEAWHLPRTSASGDGRHTMICGDAVLVDEPYEDRFFPLKWFWPLQPTCGVFAQSIAEQLAGIQLQINILLQKIQLSHHLLASGHWLVENSSQIVTGQLNNAVGGVIRYKGIAPQFFAASGVPADVYAHLDRLNASAYEVIGVSQNMASGQAPAQLSSGKALLTYADIQSKVFQPSFRIWQNWFREIAIYCIHLARQISEKHPDYSIKAAGKTITKIVRAGDALLDEDKYTLQIHETNELMDEPAGQARLVEIFTNAGYIKNVAEALRLLKVPDTDAYMSAANASYNLVQQIIDDILTRGDFTAPEPEMDLTSDDNVIKHMQTAYLQAKRNRVPEEKLDLMRRWIAEAQALKAPPPAPPGPTVANANGAPPPAPMNGAPPNGMAA